MRQDESRKLGNVPSVPYFQHDSQEINVARGTRHAIKLGHDEAAATVELNFLAEMRVHFGEERSPRLRQLFSGASHMAVGRL